MRLRIAAWTVVFLATGVLMSAAVVPQTMNYQGVLKDASGSVVSDGTYSMTLRIYNVATGGTELWTETQSVTVAGGLFDVVLGTVAAIDLAFDEQYWLGVSIAATVPSSRPVSCSRPHRTRSAPLSRSPSRAVGAAVTTATG